MKTTLKLITFATTFAIAFALVTLADSFSNTHSFKIERDFQAKVKVYNFLLADKARWKESVDKSIALRLQPKPNAMNELLVARKKLMFELYEARLKVDTSELPEDFKAAWSKLLTCEKHTLGLIYPRTLKEEALKEVRIEIQSLENEYKNSAKNYGFQLNEDNILVDE